MNRDRKIALSEELIQQAEKAKEKILADMISEQEQRLSPTQFKTAQTGILPRLAWYLALTEHGASSEEALKWIWEELVGSVGAKKRFASFCGRVPGGFSLFRKIFYQALQSDLWDNQFYQNDGWGLCFHTTRCLYKELADYYHCPEVAVLFCKVDHVMFDNLKHIRFERSQTLGEGGSLCDFHYYKQ